MNPSLHAAEGRGEVRLARLESAGPELREPATREQLVHRLIRTIARQKRLSGVEVDECRRQQPHSTQHQGRLHPVIHLVS